mgnify:FL=1|jgi:Predicted GTPase
MSSQLLLAFQVISPSQALRNLGVINYKDAKIQLLDLPGIIEGAAHGRGRGRQVFFV